MQDQVKFAALVENVLNRVMQEYQGASMNRDVIELIRHDINKRLLEMFHRCDFHLSEKAVKWLADEFFMCVNITTIRGQECMRNVCPVTDKVNLKEIPDDNLQIMTNLFGETDFGDDLFEEIQRRSN